VVRDRVNWMRGIAATRATPTQDQSGVCSLGATLASGLDSGNWLSRAMPKHSLIVAAMIDRQQTKMAADTTARYSVANPLEKFASMMLAGLQSSLIAVCMFGIATSVPSRNTPPMMNAPTTEKSTAFGAARLGSLVSSARVDAVSKP